MLQMVKKIINNIIEYIIINNFHFPPFFPPLYINNYKNSKFFGGNFYLQGGYSIYSVEIILLISITF